MLIYFGVAIRTYKVTTYFVNNLECLYLLANVGADTNASGSRHERIWEQIRMRLGRCSPKGIGFDVGSNIFRSIGPIRYILKAGKKVINETEQRENALLLREKQDNF